MIHEHLRLNQQQKTALANLLLNITSRSLNMYESLYILDNISEVMNNPVFRHKCLAHIKYWHEHIYLRKPVSIDDDDPGLVDHTSDYDIRQEYRKIELAHYKPIAYKTEIDQHVDAINTALVQSGHAPLSSNCEGCYYQYMH